MIETTDKQLAQAAQQIAEGAQRIRGDLDDIVGHLHQNVRGFEAIEQRVHSATMRKAAGSR